MADILLIQPPIRDFYLTAKRTIPYGLTCIASALTLNGFSVELLDAMAVSKSRELTLPEEMRFLEPYYGREDLSPFALFHRFRHFGNSFEHLGNRIRASGATLVGISSLFTAYSDAALETARIVKKANPDCKTVLGGHHPTALPESVLVSADVDFVLRGEGEVSFPLLAKTIQNGGSLTDFSAIPGIGFRLENGGYFINEPAFMKSLDDYPLPDADLIKHAYYKRSGRGAMVVTAGRGCPMACSYCSMGIHSGIPYRKRSVSSIIDEIEYAVTRFNVGFIDFEDENLTLDKSRFLELLHIITERFGDYHLELRAMNGLFPPSLDEEIISAMKSAGFKTLNLSVGSVQPEQLKRFSRPDVRLAFERILKWAQKYRMEAVAYMIAGAPDQKPDDSLSDLLYLADKPALAGLSIFYPAPGSRDYENCRKTGLLPASRSLMRSAALPISHTTTRTEAATLLRLSRILNFLKSIKDEPDWNSPEPFLPHRNLLPADRTKMGIQLLKWFLHDGKIRGITRAGEIYDHFISHSLTLKFLQNLNLIKIAGTDSNRL